MNSGNSGRIEQEMAVQGFLPDPEAMLPLILEGDAHMFDDSTQTRPALKYILWLGYDG